MSQVAKDPTLQSVDYTFEHLSAVALPELTTAVDEPAQAQALPSNTRTRITNAIGYWWYWPTANGDANCVMGRGNQGEAVRTLQAALRTCHHQSLDVDGIFGPDTEQALRNAQAQSGAHVDGVYGPETRSKMSWFTMPRGLCDIHRSLAR